VRDLNEVLDLQLRLPVGGKTYIVNPPPADTGARLLNRLTIGMVVDAGIDIDDETRAQAVVDDDEHDFAADCLGPALDQMTADGLSKPQIDFCVTVAFLAWTVGRDYAEQWWETGGKVGRPAGAESLAARPRTATPTPSAEASTTPSPASATGTKTKRRKQPRDRQAKASSRPGRNTAT